MQLDGVPACLGRPTVPEDGGGRSERAIRPGPTRRRPQTTSLSAELRCGRTPARSRRDRTPQDAAPTNRTQLRGTMSEGNVAIGWDRVAEHAVMLRRRCWPTRLSAGRSSRTRSSSIGSRSWTRSSCSQATPQSSAGSGSSMRRRCPAVVARGRPDAASRHPRRCSRPSSATSCARPRSAPASGTPSTRSCLAPPVPAARRQRQGTRRRPPQPARPRRPLLCRPQDCDTSLLRPSRLVRLVADRASGRARAHVAHTAHDRRSYRVLHSLRRHGRPLGASRKSTRRARASARRSLRPAEQKSSRHSWSFRRKARRPGRSRAPPRRKGAAA